MDSHLLAGVAAGVLTSTALHPLDTLKTTLQVQDGRVRPVQYSTLRQAVVGLMRQGGVRAFYKGVVPACWGSGLSWGLYFFFYESAKRRITARQNDTESGNKSKLTTWQHIYAAWEGGTCTSLLTNPVWLVKTRLQLQQGNVSRTSYTSAPYTGMFDAFRRIVREEGPLALYKGLVPALLLVSHGMVQFGLYEEAKALLGEHPAPLHIFAAAAASKAIATGVTYPYQVAKARLQQREAGEYKGLIDCLRKIREREGWRGFYKGFSANVLRVAPQSAVTLLLYEQAKRAIDALK